MEKTKGLPIQGVSSKFYDTANRVFGFGEKFTRRIVNEASIKPGESVLDCGCGTGTLAIVVKRLLGKTGKVYGIDISKDQLAIAKRKASEQGLEIAFEKASIDEMPFPDSSFDVIFSTLMLHHVPPAVRERAFREMRRVLKPNGRIVVADFGPPSRAWLWVVLFPMLLVFFLHSTSRDIIRNPLHNQMQTAGLKVLKHFVLKHVIHVVKAA